MTKAMFYPQTKKRLFTVLIVAVAVFMSTLLASSVFTKTASAQACTSAQACASQGIGDTCPNGACPDGSSNLSTTIGDIINILSIIAGIAAVIMIIIGGFRYIISGGDSNSTSGAKNTIIYALVGLVVAVLAQVLVRFVLYKIK